MNWHRFANRLWPTLALVTLTAACTNVPELDATVPRHLRDADYPELVSLDGSLVAKQTPRAQASEIEQSLGARRDRLQARARGLNTPVVDPESRKRMQKGVAR